MIGSGQPFYPTEHEQNISQANKYQQSSLKLTKITTIKLSHNPEKFLLIFKKVYMNIYDQKWSSKERTILLL